MRIAGLYILSPVVALLVTFISQAGAQNAVANTRDAVAITRSDNDSVFDPHILASFSLTDAKNAKNFSLAAATSATRETSATRATSATRPHSLRLFVFLSPECPLCKNYTVILNTLSARYADRMQCYGIVPGRSYSPATVSSFAGKYKIAYPLLIDGSFRLSRYLHATTTPEVILLDEHDELIYKGAIDNWLTGLGKQRARPTENYLDDAIAKSLRQQPAAIKRVGAVGCLINDL